MADYDLAIIGGGINGTGIARDAAGRGLRVLLAEQNDLASGTSSASTKLIHGGLRYLEHRWFRLVRDALTERERLLRMAPHIVTPMRFVLPATPEMRAPWKLRLGLWLYDHLGSRRILPKAETLDFTNHAAGHPLRRRFRAGFEYSDCWVDDARLVVLNAVDAAERGADIRTRTRVMRVERDEDRWELVMSARGHRQVATARVLINAAGPWAGIVAQHVIRLPGPIPLRLVKGSHIVVRQLFDHGCGYILQNADGRIVFALPFADGFTLIGTTDRDFDSDVDAVAPSSEEIDYLCNAVTEYFRDKVVPADVVWAFAGVRSLYDDGSGRPEDVSRDFHLALDEDRRAPPLLTVYGGKITTYRSLAEEALARLARHLNGAAPWTARAPLPGGDMPWDAVPTRIADAVRRWPFLGEAETSRMVHAYGTRIDRVVGDAGSRDAMGPWFGELSAAEVRYLMTNEWAREPDDVLWRRTKLGLHLNTEQKAELAAFMASAAPAKAATGM
jgi:glycerol-3-phosphate dehydrogenase